MVTYTQTFAGLDEQLAAADRAYRSGRISRAVQNLASREEFIGRTFADWADVKAKAGGAWAEGLAVVEGMMREIAGATLPTVTCQKRRARFADQGDEVDLDRLRAGQEFWRSMGRTEGQGGRSFCIVADQTANANKGSDEILWRGALSIVLADQLEQQGHRVEMWAVSHSGLAYRDHAGAFIATRVKSANQPVDLVTLTNALSGWYFRTVVFQTIAGETRSTANPSLGHAMPVTASDPKVQALIDGATPVVVSEVWNKAAALAFVARTIEVANQ